MRIRFRPIVAALSALTFVGIADVSVQPVRAGSLVFRMTNKDRYDMQVEFYSESRKHVWPGGNKVFNLRSGRTQRFALNCNQGEKICYGTWRVIGDELHWGVGRDDREHCGNCCFVCGRGEARVSLLDAGAPRYARTAGGNGGNVLGSFLGGLAAGLGAGGVMQSLTPQRTYRDTPAPPAPRGPAYRRSGISGLK